MSDMTQSITAGPLTVRHAHLMGCNGFDCEIPEHECASPSPEPLDELRALSDAAKPGPWRWIAEGPGEGEISLVAADTEDEIDPHVLTPHVCEACRSRNAPCLAPSQADAAFIVAAVNYVRTRIAATTPDTEEVVRFAHGDEPYTGSEYERRDGGTR